MPEGSSPASGAAPGSSAGSSTGRLLSSLRAFAAENTLDLSGLPRIIAAELHAEVCSIYLFGRAGLLELSTTAGLSPDAVGVTRFKSGEGIVGHVALTGETMNLADAETHPAYAFRIETGEGHLSAMLAHPIRRAGTTLGVLTLQSRSRLPFPEDDVEAVATAAMLLAEILTVRNQQADRTGAPSAPRHFRGVQLAPGVVSGRVKLASGYRKPTIVLAADPRAEADRLERAVARMNRDLDLLMAGHETASADGPDGDAARDVLEATRLLSGASGWLRRVREALESGLAAEAAVHRVTGELRARMGEVADPLLREKLADFEDTAFGLLAALDEERSDRPPGSEFDLLPPGTILVARRVGPAKLLHLQARGVAGLVIEEASPAGHAAILARSVGIPAIGGVRGLLAAAEDGQEAILDADEGRLLLRPEPEIARHYARALDRREAERTSWKSLRAKPDRTIDGTGFTLMLNAGLPQEMAQLEETGASGIGLFRTEIYALARGAMPSEAEQEAFYIRAFEAAGDKPLMFRTLDLGADKLLPGQPPGDEENPAMGWRSIRVGLDNPPLLRRQLRALLRAADGRPVSVMFPMISTIAEFERARAILNEVADGVPVRPERIVTGLMLEVPSLLFCLPALFETADFVSIGSNDLFQFLYAADRGAARIASRYDLFAAPSLVMIETVAEAASRAGKPLSLCGEIAARPLEAVTLASLGVTTLSMSPSGVSRVKAALISTDLEGFRTRLAELRDAGSDQEEMRRELLAHLTASGTRL